MTFPAKRAILAALLLTPVVVGIRVGRPDTTSEGSRPRTLVSTHGNMPPVRASHVLVVFNARSADGRAIADRYVALRHVPEANVLRIVCPETDEWTLAEYRTTLETFVQQRIAADPDLDYVVLTRGIPFRLSDSGSDGGFSTDSTLSTCGMNPRPDTRAANPYYRQVNRFTRGRYGILLVTRLDGPTLQSALGLIDSATHAQARRGPFYLRDSFAMNMAPANLLLTRRGFTTEFVHGFNNSRYPHYEGLGGPYMAHWGAGPHDTQYTAENYAKLKFLPGAICDITWSASAAGLRDAGSVGNIAVMTGNGAAGAQGYVSEPYADSLSKPEFVLDRYTRGYDLAESFSAGTPYVNWKQIVLGDPLCAPYAATKP
jgi:uncharacterized protein (TIGR03790 family)